MDATVGTTSSRALLAACERLGIDGAALLSVANLTAAQVTDLDGRLPVASVAALWSAAFQRSGDPGLGLRVALAVPFGAYRVIDFLAASAPTVGEGIVRVARYFPIVTSALAWNIIDEPDRRRVVLTHPGSPSGLPRPYAEYALAVTILHCRRASGFPWPLAGVALGFPAPPSTAEHVRAFGCPVAFGAEHSEFALSRETWELPSQAPSSELLRTLEDHADKVIAALRTEQPVSGQVARMIADELRGGEPSLAVVARRLAMSARTLQRRLELEDTSFASVLDRTRRHFAEAYMKEPNLALTEIAYLLGFSEQSAFSRAFHRWYGVTPSQYRARS